MAGNSQYPMGEIFRIDATSRKLLFLKQHNSVVAYSDRIDITQGEFNDVIFTRNIENIYIAEPVTSEITERTTIIDNYTEDGEEMRLCVEDSLFDNKLSYRMEELIGNEWRFLKERKQMTPVRQWINTAAALFYFGDARDISTFGGLMPSESNAEGQQNVLKRSWEIKDADSADKMLKSLLEDRSTKQFMQDNSNDELVIFIREEYGKNGIKAWDYVRAIHVSASAYIAGYFTIDQASIYGLQAAEKLQKTFTGWDEMYSNYLMGYSYWSGDSIYDKDTEAYERNQIHEKLMKLKTAPHKKIDWYYPLKKDW